MVEQSKRGFSLVELLIVIAAVSVLSAISIPQIISQRRLTRSSAVTRELMTQLRYARQLAIAERQAMTFQYDDSTKQIRIIDHNNDTSNPRSGTAVLADPSYPNIASPARVLATIPLSQGGLTSSEISYGIPTTSTGLPTGTAALPTGALGDGISMTPLSSNKINITFQADGSVVSATGVPVTGVTLSVGVKQDHAIFIFNNKAALESASAISVIGASGRVKIWRYNPVENKYVE